MSRRRHKKADDLHSHDPITAIVGDRWVHTEVVSATDTHVTFVDALPDKAWVHLRASEGISWIRGHASKEQLAALAVANALAQHHP